MNNLCPIAVISFFIHYSRRDPVHSLNLLTCHLNLLMGPDLIFCDRFTGAETGPGRRRFGLGLAAVEQIIHHGEQPPAQGIARHHLHHQAMGQGSGIKGSRLPLTLAYFIPIANQGLCRLRGDSSISSLLSRITLQAQRLAVG